MFHTYSEFDVNKYLPKDDAYTSSKIMRKYKNYLNKKKENVCAGEQNNNSMFQNNSISDIKNELLFDEYSNIDYNHFKLTDINTSSNNNLRQNDTSFNLIDESLLKSNLNHNDESIFQFHNNFFTVYVENVPYEEHINELSNNKHMNQHNRRNEIFELNAKLSSKKEHFEFTVNNNYQWYCLDYPIGKESDEFVDKFLLFEI